MAPKAVQKNIRYEAFLQGMICGEFDSLQKQQIGERLGVSNATISAWFRKTDWEHVKAERRKRYAVHMCAIDGAMVKQALKGDVNAAKLMFERFDGWVPTQARVTLTDAPDDAIKQRASEIKAELLAARERVGQDSPGAGEARA